MKVVSVNNKNISILIILQRSVSIMLHQLCQQLSCYSKSKKLLTVGNDNGAPSIGATADITPMGKVR